MFESKKDLPAQVEQLAMSQSSKGGQMSSLTKKF